MNKVLIILGATATGKSEFARICAEKFNGEIISADSIQIYKELNIGTAKIKSSEMNNIKHHLIDIKHFYESYNVWEFVKDCNKIIKDIISQKKLPIIVGGTNLYIKALIEKYDFKDSNKDLELREKFKKLAEESDSATLFNLLKEINLDRAMQINKNDKYRIIKALENFYAKDKKDDLINPEQEDYEFKLYALNLPREILYEKINQRVDIMLQNGLLDEVIYLKKQGLTSEMQAGKSIGYKELLDYLDEKITLDFAVDKIKQHSRNYAKRQLTWLRSMKNLTWLDASNSNDSIKILKEEMFD
ncbi:MAG: tRNA (adenosine(37)-N6)-dimethylallyltransferase MiaA [Clostridia bacterium]|nr:tRNA (adenosine(37)-N6)-dimethylallyltransferase MiaA [Clostridia bacterium]